MSRPQLVVTTTRVRVTAVSALFLAANEYSRLLQVLKELVQNGIDSMSTIIQVDINRQTRDISVRDIGRGVSKHELNQALDSVGDSKKTKDKLGQFGIGLVSPLGKCKSFTFTTLSKESGRQSANRWTFVSDDIKSMTDEVRIPLRENISKSELEFPVTAPHGVAQWVTEVRIHQYTKDRQISSLEPGALQQEILANFKVPMRDRKITVWITGCDERGKKLQPLAVRASAYAGKPLGEWVSNGDGGSRTNICLYVCRKSATHKGEVSVGTTDNPFRVSFKSFARKMSETKFLRPEVADALCSGIFEGDILHSKINLEPNRKGFAIDDAVVDLCVQIDGWYDEIGKEYIDTTKDLLRDERYQRLGVQSLETLRQIIKSDPILSGLVENFKFGKIGEGHAEPKRSAGIDKKPTLAATPRPKAESDGRERESGNGSESLESHMPFTATGPKGKRRRIVRGDSQGFGFEYEDSDSLDLWRFDRDFGYIVINTSHALWAKVEVNDRDLRRFQELIACLAIMLEAEPESERERVKRYAHDSAKTFASLLQTSDAFLLARSHVRAQKSS